MPVDEVGQRIGAFLREAGAGDDRHAGGRSLLEHLQGTAEILARWDQPPELVHAALLHSVYGTDARQRALLGAERRGEVAAVAGVRAERIAYLFAVTPRRALFSGTHRWARGVAGDGGATRDELDAVLLLHIANLADQAAARDGSPGQWLARAGELAELLTDSDAVRLPRCFAALMAGSPEDEAAAGHDYRSGVAGGGEGRSDALALAAARCPAVGEPCVWLAFLALAGGRSGAATEWARAARRRLSELGVAWDKRLSYEQWQALAERLEAPGDSTALPDAAAVTTPQGLLEALTAGTSGSHPPAGPPSPARFLKYMELLAQRPGRGARVPYPDLDSRPWFEPGEFGLARYLEAHHDEIRAELLALDAARFHPEAERIGRTGDWDVAFLYERGRRRDEVCEACPVTTRGIESDGVMRTLGGLIYVSRMRAGTHIAAHRGPTNLRLRCHLGITVPDGDCAIRVGDETRRWRAGGCLVFDDHFEHEAWNHTGEDRIVLIVDLWHPGLSAAEIRLLEGLHGYADAAAHQLHRYWSMNERAAAAGQSPAS